MHTGISATTVGGGWARFVTDHNLNIGAFLTFELVDERRLIVSIHRRSGAEDYAPAQTRHVSMPAVLDRRDREPPEVDNSRSEHSAVLPVVCCNDRPQFRKTLRKTAMRKCESSKLVSAHIQFPLISLYTSQVSGFFAKC